MQLPFDALLSVLTNHNDVDQAWRECCDLVAAAAPGSGWEALGQLRPSADVDATKTWLVSQLDGADQFLEEVEQATAAGLVVWLEPQALEDGEHWCVELGACADVSVDSPSLEWVEQCPWAGELFLPSQLVRACKIWRKASAPHTRDAMEYVSFLFYVALILLQALEDLSRSRPLVVAWGFQDGDQGLLWRTDGRHGERLAWLAADDVG